MKRPCTYPGCPNLVENGPRCELHPYPLKQWWRNADKNRMAKDDTSEAARFRWSSRWRKIRRIKLVTNPICEDPHGIHGDDTHTATEVHHIIPIVEYWEGRDDLSNLMSLCHRCHEVFTRTERRKGL